MERLSEEMICRYEDCSTDEEHCPYLNEDSCPCLQEILEKLAEYEDLEEQGKLLKLPCVVGDTVYWVKKRKNEVVHSDVREIGMDSDGVYVITGGCVCNESDFGKDVFLTEEEAETALKAISG